MFAILKKMLFVSIFKKSHVSIERMSEFCCKISNHSSSGGNDGNSSRLTNIFLGVRIGLTRTDWKYKNKHFRRESI